MDPLKHLRRRLVPPVARYMARRHMSRLRSVVENPLAAQKTLFRELIQAGRDTTFGKDHGFKDIADYSDFKQRVPVRDYDSLKSYIEKVLESRPDVLWKGRPVALGISSGTTSGGASKYIPVTKDSLPLFRRAWWHAIFSYILETDNPVPVTGRIFYMRFRRKTALVGGIPAGYITAITGDRVPLIFRNYVLPSSSTVGIQHWDELLDAMIKEAVGQDITVMCGLPFWMQLFFDRFQEKTGRKIGEAFPRLSVLMFGGVNYGPYRPKLEESLGRPFDVIDCYMATEGFIAFQDSQAEQGLLLNLTGGIYFEFVPLNEAGSPDPKRICLEDVEPNVDYALVLSTNAGLWAYDIGDTVKFISRNPFRIVVTGRTKHYITLYDERVTAEQAEAALTKAMADEGVQVREFSVAPQTDPAAGLPHYEWYIEFEHPPADITAFAAKLDTCLCNQNVLYDDSVSIRAMGPLAVFVVKQNGFKEYIASIGKLGGQHKVPRVCNDRTVADSMQRYTQREVPAKQ